MMSAMYSINVMKKNTGYSLIEIMVVMLIGLIILNGVFQVIVTSKQGQKYHKEISYVQENARFALDILSRDIRMAGYIGCASQNTNQANVITDDVMGFISTSGFYGFDGEQSSDKFPAIYRDLVNKNTDSLLIRRGEAEEEKIVRSQSPLTGEITLWSPHEFSANQPLILVDGNCSFSSIFTASGTPDNTTILHKADSNNCSSTLKGNYNCADCNGGQCKNSFPAAAYLSGARIMPLISNAYFIGDSTLSPGTPALKRQSIVTHKGKVTTRTEELATGIENIQFIYGVDVNDNNTISEYRRANNMDINGDGVIDSLDWSKVLSVKISMLLKSRTPVLLEPQTITFDGIQYPGLFMRQVVSTTIKVRNKKS